MELETSLAGTALPVHLPDISGNQYSEELENNQARNQGKNKEKPRYTSHLNLRPLQGQVLEYYTTKTGTYIVRQNEKGDEETKKLSIVEIKFLSIVETDNGRGKSLRYVTMQIDFIDNGTDKSGSKITVLLSSLNNLARRTEDTATWLDVGGDTKKAIAGGVLYDVAISAWRLGLITKKTGYLLPGWHGKVHVRPGDELCTSYETYEQIKGTFEAWLDGVNPVLEGNPIPQLVLSFYAGAYLRGLSGFSVEGSNIIALTSGHETSTGKTTLMRIGQSFDRPAITIPSASSTIAATENMLVEHNGGHVSFDEIHSLIAREKNPVVRLMDFCNGGDRNKMLGMSESGSKTWNVTMFMSGNTRLGALAEGNEQHDAFNARIFELDFSKDKVSQQDRVYKQYDAHLLLDNASSVINENYGHVYERIIALIQGNTQLLSKYFKDFLLESYETYSEVVGRHMDYMDEIGDTFEDQKGRQVAVDGAFTRKAKSCALAAVGAVMLEKIGVNVSSEIVHDELQKLLMKEIKRKVDDTESIKDKVRQEIDGFINRLLKEYIRVDGCLALNEEACSDGFRGEVHLTAEQKQKEDAERHNKQNIKTIYGIIEQKEAMYEPTDFNGKIWINTHPSAIDYYKMIKLGDLNAIADRAKKAGILITDTKNNRTKVQKRPFGPCYCFDLSAA